MEQQVSLQAVYQDPIYAEFGKQCDTHLKTDDGTTFKVHSELLSKRSKYFHALFSMDKEIAQTTPVIRGIKSEIFESILIYLYTGHMRLTKENMIDLLVASDYLMMESLIIQCRLFVYQNMTVENCIYILLTAYKIEGLGIMDKCRRFLLLCFEKAVLHSVDEACCLPYEVLQYILSHRSVNVSGERTVWSFIEAWVHKNRAERLAYVPELLMCLRMDEIDEELASTIISSGIIRLNELYEVFGDPSVTLGDLTNKQKCHVVISYRNYGPLITRVRLPRSVYFISTNFSEGSELSISYDDSLDFCRKLGEISLKDVELLGVAHRVYFLEHNGYGKFRLCGLFYDLLRNEVKGMALPSYRHYVVGQAGGRVYALDNVLGNVQQYVDEKDEWIDVSAIQGMTVERAVNVNGLLYVTGTRAQDLVMQVYYPFSDRWKTVSPPNLRRYCATAVTYQGKIFLLGGRRGDLDDDEGYVDDIDVNYDADVGNIDDDNEDTVDYGSSRDVEVYDPLRDEWVLYPKLPFRMYPLLAEVVKERLYVCEKSGRPVAYWDESGQWEVVKNLSPESIMWKCKFCAVEEEDVVREIMKKNKAVLTSVWQQTGLEEEMQ